MIESALPEDHPAEVLPARRSKAGIPPESTAARAVAHARAQGASLGTAHLGTGANLIGVVAAIFGLLLFGQRLDLYPNLTPIVAAWLLFLGAFTMITVRVLVRGETVPAWLSRGYFTALALVVGLDLVAIWSLHDVGRTATVSVVAGFGLVAVVTLRPARELIIAASVLFLALVGAILATTPLTPETVPAQLTALMFAVAPTFFGIFVLRRFRQMVQLELDRVLIRSTVTAPRFVVGMLASEDLARLDLAAEELLDSVASGRSELPLVASVAGHAGALATELRLHLIEGRRETWLYHAMLESNQLGTAATLRDPESLAGLLNPVQRDGLLSAVWLLVADNKKTKSTARVTLGPVPPRPARGTPKVIVVPISITTTGVSRNRIDPSIWAAIAKVGVSVQSTENQSLRVDIDGIVPNPANR